MSRTHPNHADSIEEREMHETEKKVKSRRPANTAFRQQRLKAWQPILTPKTVLPLFFILGIVFAPIGGLLIYASAKVQEIVIDYSECASQAPKSDDMSNFGVIPKDKYYSYFKNDIKEGEVPTWKQNTTNITYSRGMPAPPGTKGGVNVSTTICSIQFQIPDDLAPPVLFYYRLTNFYQNHRRYVKSLDTDQLAGTATTQSSCDPLRNATDGRPYYPCGLIANSQFNDTFVSPVGLNIVNEQDLYVYNMTSTGIAWDSDKKLYKKTAYKPNQIAVPRNWYVRWGDNGYTDDNPPPPLDEDEAFQVWMRTAGLPAFSKLALRNDTHVMKSGRYMVDIRMNFPVTEYGGTKSIVISTRTVMGGRNPFLGIAYIVVSGLCVVLGVVFMIAHLIKPRKLGDHTYLTWNNDQPSTATATGISRPGHDTA